jgi:hypothetical protein
LKIDLKLMNWLLAMLFNLSCLKLEDASVLAAVI